MSTLANISHITIGDLLSFAPTMKLSIKEAVPIINEFKARHKLTTDDVKDVCRVIVKLGLEGKP